MGKISCENIKGLTSPSNDPRDGSFYCGLIDRGGNHSTSASGSTPYPGAWELWLSAPTTMFAAANKGTVLPTCSLPSPC